MRYDIRAKVRTYKDNKTGEEKNVYATIGSAWIGEKTNSITLDTIPVNWDGKAFINEPYELTPKGSQSGSGGDIAPDNGEEPINLDSIPF